MAFTDVIDNYANGTTGTLTTTSGGSVGYTITSNASTVTRIGIDQGARVTADGSEAVQVGFNETVHGVSFAMGASNPGEIYFVEINGVQIDLNTAIADGTVSFTQGGAATHFVTASGGLTSTGAFSNGSVAFIHFQSPVDTIRIFGSGGGNSNFDAFDIGIDSVDFRIVCFCAGTDIATPNGPGRVESIGPGDLVSTIDGAVARVVDVTARTIRPIQLAHETRLLPVRVSAGALGHGLPNKDLCVSRQHRLLVASRIAARLCNQTEVLIPALKLVGLPGIDFETSMSEVTYHHLQLDRHAVLIANGAPAESLFVGASDESDSPAKSQAMSPARPFIDGKLSKKVAAAHAKHARPVLEAWSPSDRSRHDIQLSA